MQPADERSGADLVDLADEDLMERIVEGSEAAFALLVKRYQAKVTNLVFRFIYDRERAMEIAQEVFLRAFQKLGTLRDPQRFASWLAGIARKVCREWRRGRLRPPGRRAILSDTIPAAEPDNQADDRITLLRDALGCLPQRERLSLQAFYLQGMDAEQARQVLGLSRATLYRVLSSARRQLRNALAGQEVLP